MKTSNPLPDSQAQSQAHTQSGIAAIVDNTIIAADCQPACPTCGHTFNAVEFGFSYCSACGWHSVEIPFDLF